MVFYHQQILKSLSKDMLKYYRKYFCLFQVCCTWLVQLICNILRVHKFNSVQWLYQKKRVKDQRLRYLFVFYLMPFYKPWQGNSYKNFKCWY